jgi:hypothetical protein
MPATNLDLEVDGAKLDENGLPDVSRQAILKKDISSLGNEVART